MKCSRGEEAVGECEVFVEGSFVNDPYRWFEMQNAKCRMQSAKCQTLRLQVSTWGTGAMSDCVMREVVRGSFLAVPYFVWETERQKCRRPPRPFLDIATGVSFWGAPLKAFLVPLFSRKKGHNIRRTE